MNKYLGALILANLGLFLSTLATENAMPKKTYVSFENVQSMCQEIFKQAQDQQFNPDLLIGIARGGLTPLALLSGEQMFDNRYAISVNLSSYDRDRQSEIKQLMPIHIDDLKSYKNILIVDDLVDSGKSVQCLFALLQKELPSAIIKVATLYYKKRSCVKPDFYAQETQDWIVFPWEKQT